MLKSKYILFLFIAIMLVACRDEDVHAPKLDVSVENTTVKEGDSVVFFFDGQPDVITFYSGEPGHEYKNKDRTYLEGANVLLDFNSRLLWGSQKDNMRVMLSTNFSGIYDSLSVKKAEWKNITDKFTLDTSPAGGSGVNTPSGKVDITNMIDVVDPSKPFYVAFQYVGEPSPGTTSTQRTCRITEFNVTAKYPAGESVLANLVSAAWLQVNIKNSDKKWVTSATQLQYTPAGELNEAEGWAITKPLYPTKVYPDLGVAIKSYEAVKRSHVYKFEQAGIYVVTFVASNVTHIDQKTTVKEITITVEK